MSRRPGARVWRLILVSAFVAGGCSRQNGTARLNELRRVRSGALDVVMLSPRDALHHGRDTFVIEFRSTSGGNLIDVGNVRGRAGMLMPGTPMFVSIDVTRSDVAGRYEANGNFDMAGTWRVTIQWEGPAGQGSVTFPGSVL